MANTSRMPITGADKPAPRADEIPFRERLGCTPRQACAALGIGRTLLYGLIAAGRVEVGKLGRRTIVIVPSLLELLDAQGTEPQPRRRGRPRKSNPGGGAS
jgi:hypothetical protein